MQSNILVAEISGKRPGSAKQRPTEKFNISFDKVIISNNSEGYETDWEIVNVPADYVEYYKATAKISDNAWYAPMNRSYAIKYAREHGYKYLVQLDDNIQSLSMEYIYEQNGHWVKYRAKDDMMNDFIDTFKVVLENTNAGMVGCALSGVKNVERRALAERYVYSIFALDVDICPEIFQGGFEDDIEYRLKLKQLSIPCVQIQCFKYGKTGQKSAKDESGNRKAYTDAGLKRGEQMARLYGDVYSCRFTNAAHNVRVKADSTDIYFKHILKPWKIGIIYKDKETIDRKLNELFKKYARTEQKGSAKMKQRKVKRR